MKLAKFLWTLASFYLLAVGFVYIFILKDAPVEGLARLDFIRENWGVYAYQWKAEFLVAVSLAAASLIFGSRIKNVGFQIIAIGQLLVAMAFPISIGSTPNASYDLYWTISEATSALITFGMVISLSGFIVLYSGVAVLSKWLRVTALFLSSVCLMVFGAGFLGIISHSDTHKGMIIVMLLYVINSYYGLKLGSEMSNN